MKSSEYRKQCIAVLNAARQRWNETFKRKPPVAPVEDNLISMNFGPSRSTRRWYKSLIRLAKRRKVARKEVAELTKQYISAIPNEPYVRGLNVQTNA